MPTTLIYNALYNRVTSLKDGIHPIHIKVSVRTSQRTRSSLIRDSQLIVHKKRIIICYVNHMKHTHYIYKCIYISVYKVLISQIQYRVERKKH
jgi:hypothetical protein